MYDKVFDDWLGAFRKPSGHALDCDAELWSKWFTDFYKIMFNAVPGPQYMLKDLKMNGMSTPETLFGEWKPFFFALPYDSDSLSRGIDHFIAYSRSWKNNFIRLYDAWIRCLERTSEACRSTEADENTFSKAMKAGMVNAEEFMDTWRQYTLDQTEAFNDFVTSLRQAEFKKEKVSGLGKQGKKKGLHRT